MAQINPALPGPLDPAGRNQWALQMNAVLQDIIDQGNALDARLDKHPWFTVAPTAPASPQVGYVWVQATL